MVDMLIAAYFGCWIVVTVAVYGATRWFADRRSPAPHPLLMSIVAGAVWPLLLVGLVELSSVMVYTKVQHKPEPRVGILV
jgi:Na+-transporting NADH:ubiquinone oxidoreductase subunit NqrE